MPEVLSTSCPRAALKAKCTVFPIRSDQGGQVNPVFGLRHLMTTLVIQGISESFILEALWGPRHLTFDFFDIGFSAGQPEFHG